VLAVLNSIDYGVALIDLSVDKVLDSNSTFRNWLKLDDDGHITVSSLFSDEILQKARSRGKFSFEMEVQPAHGRPFPVDVSIKAVSGHDEHFTVQLANASKAREKELLLKTASQQIDLNNRQLARQKRAMAELLDNMRQAVFTVGSGLKVEGMVSKFTSNVFAESIVGLSIMDTVFKDLDRGTEEFTLLNASLPFMFGQDSFQYDLLAGNLPRKVDYRNRSSGVLATQVLKIAYTPIFEGEAVDRIMMVVEDVTQYEILERQVEIERKAAGRRIKIIQEIVDVQRNHFNEFCASGAEYLRSCLATANSLASSISGVEKSFRALHTFKGNARVLKLSYLATKAHEVEDYLSTLKLLFSDPNAERADASRRYCNELTVLKSIFDEYLDVFNRLKSDGNGSSLNEKMYLVPKDRMRALKEAIAAANVIRQDGLMPLLMLADSVTALPFSGIRDMLENVVVDLGERLNKVVDLRIVGAECEFQPEILQTLRDCIGHILRNSIDHGLESASERTSAGKTAAGHIDIELSQSGSMSRLRISDDGRGINLEAVKMAAIAAGSISPEAASKLNWQQNAELIFLPSLTTKTEVSEVSGRGVGMDFVRSSLRELGGDIVVHSTHGKGTEFVITIPQHSAAYFEPSNSVAA
jgi:two-component system chemotaxis sensor kinase CheA